ncbi:MAG: inositol monophosphatase [Candidatus Aenigmarchaeota archaeon]|nr:inositol monophosphatase [Candidatus Aenigmarchaeota archaeon]
MKTETKAAIQAAKAAGRIAKKYFRKKLLIEKKTDDTPVTIADRECEKKIVGVLKEQFPGYSILGEESGFTDNRSECKWIIDPIDGTKEFIAGLPFFGTLIALEKKGKIVSGVAYMPLFNTLAFAERGKGAYVNGKKAGVSKRDKIENSLVMYGSIKTFFKKGVGEKVLNILKIARSKSIGSVYGDILVAQGIADASVEAAAHPWDIAAAKIIVEEAGGKVTDFSGNDTIHGGNAVVSNGRIHEKIIEILNRGRE